MICAAWFAGTSAIQRGPNGANRSSSDPIGGLPAVFPGWFVTPYLLFAVVQLLAVNTLDLYSSGVTLQALGLRVSRVQAVAVDTVLCAAVTAIALFNSSFYNFVVDMVLFVMVWLAPWCAVFIVDYLMRRGRYDSNALHGVGEGRGIYWLYGGFRWTAFAALAAGIVVSLLMIDTTVYAGPIANALGGADLSIPIGFAVTALVYWALARTSVAAEAELVEDPLAGHELAVPRVDDDARRRPLWPTLADQCCMVAAGHKTNLDAVRLVRNPQPRLARQRTHLFLAITAERKQQRVP